MPAIQHIKKPPNVLVVCHGNICRSPLAEVVLREAIPQELVRSRGMKPGGSGKPAAKKVREYGETLGYDLSQHRSMEISQEDIVWADIIVYMDNGNLRRLITYQQAKEKCRCLGRYINRASIPDPNFTPRGTRLDYLLSLVIDSSKALAETLL